MPQRKPKKGRRLNPEEGKLSEILNVPIPPIPSHLKEGPQDIPTRPAMFTAPPLTNITDPGFVNALYEIFRLAPNLQNRVSRVTSAPPTDLNLLLQEERREYLKDPSKFTSWPGYEPNTGWLDRFLGRFNRKDVMDPYIQINPGNRALNWLDSPFDLLAHEFGHTVDVMHPGYNASREVDTSDIEGLAQLVRASGALKKQPRGSVFEPLSWENKPIAPIPKLDVKLPKSKKPL